VGYWRALYAARALEAAGAIVVNSAAATQTAGDKWLTTTALLRHQIPTPATALALTCEAAGAGFAEVGFPAVVKPLVGSWGRLVTRVRDAETAEAVLDHIQALPSPQSHVVYVQEMVAKPDRDLRVVVVGGQVLGATYRRGAQWRTNVARGGVSEVCSPGEEHVRLALAAAEAVGTDIAGVDLLEDTDGRLTVLEVNDRVEFRGFQQAHGDQVNVADAIVSHLLTRSAS
jgi:[lysine-biosynthesis-protein LysW]--L-2-aminoadipate ligase